MKQLIVHSQDSSQSKIYKQGEKAATYPQEFVKDILYKNGVWTICYSDNKRDWFKSMVGFKCTYIEHCAMNEKSNFDELT